MLAAFAGLLPAADYLPMLLRVTPRLVTPVAEDDYFAHEQVATWGIDSHWALTHFLLDGHHKLEAAAATGCPLQLLALVTVDASSAAEADIRRLPDIRAQAKLARRRLPTR